MLANLSLSTSVLSDDSLISLLCLDDKSVGVWLLEGDGGGEEGGALAGRGVSDSTVYKHKNKKGKHQKNQKTSALRLKDN